MVENVSGIDARDLREDALGYLLRCRLTTHSTGAASSVAFIRKVDCRPVNSSVRLPHNG